MFLAWLEPHLENDQKNQISIEIGSQLKEPLAKMSETNTRLVKIDESLEDLKPFIHDVIAHQFQNALKLSPQALGTRLPAVRNLLTVAQNQGVQVDPQTTYLLSQRMSQIQTKLPDFWPTATQLISYRSSLFWGGESATLPICLPKDMRHWGVDGFEFSNCFLDLDGKTLANDRCVHCVVRYSGGYVSIQNLELTDCLLIFSVTGDKAPSQNGQKLEQTLLTSDLRNITISGIS